MTRFDQVLELIQAFHKEEDLSYGDLALQIVNLYEGDVPLNHRGWPETKPAARSSGDFYDTWRAIRVYRVLDGLRALGDVPVDRIQELSGFGGLALTVKDAISRGFLTQDDDDLLAVTWSGKEWHTLFAASELADLPQPWHCCPTCTCPERTKGLNRYREGKGARVHFCPSCSCKKSQAEKKKK